MNWVDAALIGLVLLAMWGGWKRGFILGISDLLIWLGSLLIAFLSYTFLGSFLRNGIPSLGVWTLPLAFIFALALARIILSFLFKRLLAHTSPDAHEHGVNHFLGLLPGFVNGLWYATLAAALLFALPLSSQLSVQTKGSQFAASLSNGVAWLDNQLNPIFGDATRTALNGMTAKPDSDETVELPFTVAHAKPRPDLEIKMLALVNKERMERGLQPLKPDPELTKVGRAHSEDMFLRGYFSHYTPEGKDPFERMKADNIQFLSAGENLALGQTLMICHEGLMNSPGHRANILKPAYGRLGIGILDGGIRGLMISQEFRN